LFIHERGALGVALTRCVTANDPPDPSDANDGTPILADSVEALLGAVFLDSGFEAARQAVATLFAERLDSAVNKPVDKDPKTALQEHLQGRGLALPRYAVQKTEGEAHEQTFIVECRVDDLGIVAGGQGTSRRAAEQAAAEGVLKELEKAPRRKKT